MNEKSLESEYSEHMYGCWKNVKSEEKKSSLRGDYVAGVSYEKKEGRKKWRRSADDNTTLHWVNVLKSKLTRPK
jgi:hypothetical protein